MLHLKKTTGLLFLGPKDLDDCREGQPKDLGHSTTAQKDRPMALGRVCV